MKMLSVSENISIKPRTRRRRIALLRSLSQVQIVFLTSQHVYISHTIRSAHFLAFLQFHHSSHYDSREEPLCFPFSDGKIKKFQILKLHVHIVVYVYGFNQEGWLLAGCWWWWLVWCCVVGLSLYICKPSDRPIATYKTHTTTPHTHTQQQQQ